MTSTQTTAPIASVDGLQLTGPDGTVLVDGVSLTLTSRKTVALVGESGSGKTLTVKALAGLLPRGVRHTGGSVSFDGKPHPPLTSRAFRRSVRDRIGYVFQDPMVALNPLMNVFDQVAEAVDPARRLRERDRNIRTWDLLRQVALPDLDATARKLPGELSGGMCQRVVIAMAIARSPRLLIADEPTTALDVTIQRQILTLLTSLRDRLDAALVLISHDLGLVASHADEVTVLRGGTVVERASTTRIVHRPADPYTRELLAATPTLSTPQPNADLFAAGRGDILLEGRALTKSYRRRRHSGTVVLHAADVAVARGESVGVVGESGSGKSTLLKLLAGVETADSGAVFLDGAPAWDRAHTRRNRVRVQVMFQDSWGSFDPYLTIAESVAEPLLVSGRLTRQAAKAAVGALLDEVGLPAHLGGRRPHELSGGQRQRAGIARALALSPDVLLADEPVSALDVSVQARIIDLLARLQRERGMSMVVVSHDLAVIRLLTSRLYVMRDGQVVEHGTTDAVIAGPHDPFTRQLVASIPVYGTA